MNLGVSLITATVGGMTNLFWRLYVQPSPFCVGPTDLENLASKFGSGSLQRVFRHCALDTSGSPSAQAPQGLIKIRTN